MRLQLKGEIGALFKSQCALVLSAGVLKRLSTRRSFGECPQSFVVCRSRGRVNSVDVPKETIQGR